MDLFSDLEEEEKERNIQKAMLAIRNCYGACISATYFERYMEFGNEIGSYHTVTGTVEFISKEKSECVLTIWN